MDQNDLDLAAGKLETLPCGKCGKPVKIYEMPHHYSKCKGSADVGGDAGATETL